MSADNVIPIRGGAKPRSASRVTLQAPSPTSVPPAGKPRRKRRRNLNRAQVAERIESEREKLFGVLGVVSTVRELLRESKFDNCGWALETAYDILDDVAAAMEANTFLDECGTTAKS